MGTAAKTAPEYVEFPLPVTIGGTAVDEKRVIGPPARMLPSLRDLGTGTIKVNERFHPDGEVTPRITVELDLESKRVVGQVTHLSNQPGRSEQLILWEGVTTRKNYDLSKILAYRVLKVEVPRFPEIH